MPISILTVKRLIAEGAQSGSSAISSSYATTASYALVAQSVLGSIASASYAATSSLPLLGIVTASASNTTITFTKGNGTTFDVTVSQSGSVSTASYALYALQAGSASYALTASYLSFDPNIFKQTGSYWNTTRNIGITGSLQMNFNGTSDYFSVAVSGQEKVKINTQGTLQLVQQSVTPTAIEGGIFYSSSDAFYLGFNS